MSQPFDFLTFPLSGSQLIEASAGTGKTFSLALLYTRLVLGHGHHGAGFLRPLVPKEILVVTFTEAAAGELRDRIRARLVEAAAFFQDASAQRAEHDPLQRLRADYPADQWLGCAWRLKLAAESMDEASIATIHSWCNRVLTEYAFDTRGLFNRELVTDQSELLHQVVKDYWRKHFYPLSATQVALVRNCYASPEALLSSLMPVLYGEHQGICYQGVALSLSDQTQLLAYLDAKQVLEQQRITLEKAAKQAWLQDFEAIQTYLLSIRSRLNGTTHGSSQEAAFIELLNQIQAWAKGEADAPSKLKSFATGAFKFKKNQEVEPKPFAAFTALAEMENPPPLAQNKGVDPELPLDKVILAHAYHWVKQAFSAQMQKRAEMGFDDLLTELWRALKGDQGQHLASLLVRHFPVAMIDEFQDTDPVQYGIFDAIYQVKDTPSDRGLMMIGDPKQAIYSFRGADIHTYLKARAATEGTTSAEDRHYTLATNYRSTQGVVSACNHLFQQAESHPRAAFRFKGEGENPVPYVEVAAAGKNDQFLVAGASIKPLTLFAVEPTQVHDKDESGYLISQTDYRQQAAEIAASQVVRWLNQGQQGQAGFGHQQIERPLQPKDIAILVRTGAEARLIREALYQRNVASVYLSDKESVFASPEAQDLLHWLRACADPSNEALVRAALGSNTLDLPLALLAQWREDELGWEQQMLRFIQLRQIWYRQGVLALVRELLEQYQVAARLLQKPEGERALTNLLHVAEWLQQAAMEIRGDQALIRHLAEQIAAEDQQQILRLESDADLVKVITIHKSKGLEYPLVLLPFIGSWKRVDGNTKVVNWRSGAGLFKEISGDSKSEAWAQADDERLSEDMRLLYVALTRASHLLWLGVGALKEGNSGSPQIERSAMGYLLNGGQPVKDSQAVIALYRELAEGCSAIQWLDTPPPVTTTCYQPNQNATLVEARATQGMGRLTDWWITSYSSLHFDEMSTPEHSAFSLETTEASTAERPIEPETGRESTADEFLDETLDELESPVQVDRFIHQFPGGAEWGTFLHGLMEWSAAQRTPATSDQPALKGFSAVAEHAPLRQAYVARLCQLREISDRATGLEAWLKAFLEMRWQFNGYPSDTLECPPRALQLSSLSMRQVMVEMEFLLTSHQVHTADLDHLVRTMTLAQAPRPMAKPSVLNGMLKGFIDLVVEYNGRYYVVDWKSNKLGQSDADYTRETMLAAILKKRYDLQYVLYSLALHRQLKARLPNYDYDRHFGGAVYVFLRGWQADSQGLFYDRPPKALIEALDQLFTDGRPRHPSSQPQGAHV